MDLSLWIYEISDEPGRGSFIPSLLAFLRGLLEDLTRSPQVSGAFVVALFLVLSGCTTVYQGYFGPYTHNDAISQYESLGLAQYVRINNGWLTVYREDIEHLNISELVHRYCQMDSITVPFPMIIEKACSLSVDRESE